MLASQAEVEQGLAHEGGGDGDAGPELEADNTLAHQHPQPVGGPVAESLGGGEQAQGRRVAGAVRHHDTQGAEIEVEPHLDVQYQAPFQAERTT